jgi:chromosomal replication initiator protein
MSTVDTAIVWHDTLEAIKVSVSGAIFSTWFSQTYLAEVIETKERFTASIGCGSSYVKSTLESRYFGLVQDSLSKTLGKPCDLIFLVKELPSSKTRGEFSAPLFQKESTDESFLLLLKKSRIKPTATFQNYAVSSSNQMAHAAAEAVAENPSISYNPLFVWGGVGVGKTHLVNAIGHKLLELNPNSKVLFCTGEDFTNDIVEGIRNKTTQQFRDKYRKLDALFIDDIQFIAGKDAVQEEFFHTFNAVTGVGGQIALISDRPPSEISKLEERLRSRFEAGLIVDIAPPDFELRCAIVQIKTKEKGLELSGEAVQMIAGNIDSARKIEGFLIQLTSVARLRKTEVSEEMIASLLGKGEKESVAVRAGPDEVIDAVSKHFSLGKRQLLGDSRARPVARPRQILMYLLRTYLGLPLEEVGRIIGGRDHTTVMHAVEKITTLASTDVQIREDLLGIKGRL